MKNWKSVDEVIARESENSSKLSWHAELERKLAEFIRKRDAACAKQEEKFERQRAKLANTVLNNKLKLSEEASERTA
ncbi:MAG: hypothetical protein IJS68_03625 [Clostridia bacterium]|nr:hypothetical protein [Clostridia bacterium]